MRSLLITATLLAALGGCSCLDRVSERCHPLGPQCEGQEAKEIEVQAPRQKVVVDMPNRTTTCQAPCPPAAPCQGPAPAAPAAAPTTPVMGYPQYGLATGRMFGIGFMTMPVTGAPAMVPMTAPFTTMPFLGPTAQQAPATTANMSISGNMTVTQALMMLIASGTLSQAQVNEILRILGLPPSPVAAASPIQPGAQVQRQAQQLASLLAAPAAANPASGSPAATPTPNGTPSSAGSPSAADNASGDSPQRVPGPGSEATAPSSIQRTLAPFQEQLRQAEERLRELEQSSAQPQK